MTQEAVLVHGCKTIVSNSVSKMLDVQCSFVSAVACQFGFVGCKLNCVAI